MTYEEHVARAALMDRTFDWRDGTYVHNIDEINDYIHAETLEPVKVEWCRKRMNEVGSQEYGMSAKGYERWRRDNPYTPLPWITSGGNDDG